MEQKKLDQKIIRYFPTVSSFMKKNKKRLAECLNFKGFTFESKDEFIDTGINPSILGTMLDTLASWHITGEIDVDKYHMDRCYEIIYDVKDMDIFKKAYVSAMLTSQYRSGYPIDYKEVLSHEFSSEQIKKLEILHKRIKSKLDSEEGKIDNPEFISQKYFLKGDGDYIYGKTLCDFKSSKVPKITLDHVRQLFLYYFLDVNSDKSYEIDKVEIYNPLYNFSHTIKIKELVGNLDFFDEIEKERTQMFQKLCKEYSTL